MRIDNPLITVITVSYNSVSVIEDTIESVLKQTYPRIEYIIIDGGSRDGTVDIIRQYEKSISFWISEKDSGVYHAMNKGIDRATGEWLIFMNSGDRFYSETILSQVFEHEYKSDIIYGAVELDYGFTKIIKRPYPLECLPLHMCFSHQSCFVRTDLMKKTKFDTNYSIVADYAFFLEQYKKGNLFHQLPFTISTYDNVNGISSAPNIKVLVRHLNELQRIEEFHGSIYFEILKFLVKRMIRCICPKFILKIYYRKVND